MPKTDGRSLTPTGASLPAKLGGGETRIDAAHSTRLERAATMAGEPLALESDGPPAGQLPPPDEHHDANWDERQRQLHAQAEQLAAFLRERHQELDRREARLNAQVAAIENETRAARMWVAERHHEFDERGAALDEREMALDERAAAVTAAERGHDTARREHEADLRRCTAELDRRAAQLDAAARRLGEQDAAHQTAQERLESQRLEAARQAAFERQQIEARRVASLELVRQLHQGLERRRAASQAEFDAREAALTNEIERVAALRLSLERQAAELAQRSQSQEETSIRLGAEAAELAAARQALSEDRARLENERTWAQRETAVRQQQLDEELAERRTALDEAAAELDEREAELERLRQELDGVHRETLEARLATEQLWAQWMGDVSPSSWERTLKDVRRRLAARMRAAEDELRRRQVELLEVEDRLRRGLEQLRGEHRSWHEQMLAAQRASREQQLSSAPPGPGQSPGGRRRGPRHAA